MIRNYPYSTTMSRVVGPGNDGPLTLVWLKILTGGFGARCQLWHKLAAAMPCIQGHGFSGHGSGYRNKKNKRNTFYSLARSFFIFETSKFVTTGCVKNMIFRAQILLLNVGFLSLLPLVLFIFSRIFSYFSLNCGSRNFDGQSGRSWQDHVAAQPWVICNHQTSLNYSTPTVFIGQKKRQIFLDVSILHTCQIFRERDEIQIL